MLFKGQWGLVNFTSTCQNWAFQIVVLLDHMVHMYNLMTWKVKSDGSEHWQKSGVKPTEVPMFIKDSGSGK